MPECGAKPPRPPAPSGATSRSARRNPAEISATLHTVAIVLQRMRQRGISAGALLAGSGISEDDVRQPGRLVTQAQELVVIANALERSGDSRIGLEIGAAMHLPSYGILGYAMLVSPTLAAALRCAITHRVLLGSYFDIEVEIEGGTARIVASNYHFRPDLEVVNTDMCLASMWAMVCDVLGARLQPSALSLRFPAPAHAEAYPALIGACPGFDAARNALSFPGEWLDRPLQFAEPVSHHMATRQCDQLEREWSVAAGDGVLGQVLRLLYSDARRFGSLQAVAATLCMSPRTLRRRLQDRGTSFQALLDQALHERALEYLTRTDMPIAHIAEQLGYSEPSSFRQAFRRWTGKAPSAVRGRERRE